MIITTTTIGFYILSSGLAVCGFRFLSAFWKMNGSRSENRIGLLLSVHLFATAFQNGVMALGTLFFAKDTEALYILFTLDHFLLLFATMFGIYLAFYILRPAVSPRPAIAGSILLGATLIVSTIATHPKPFIDASNGIDWNASGLVATLLFFLVSLNIGMTLIIFINSFLRVKSPKIKIISFVVSLTAILGIINMLFRFLLQNTSSTSLQTRIFDAILVIIGLLFLAVFLPSPKIIAFISKFKDSFGQKKEQETEYRIQGEVQSIL